MLQGALAGAILLMLAFVPPVHGRTLLVPLDGEPIGLATLDRLLLSPLRHGPLPGSVVVEGRARELATGLLGEGIVMLAAPAALCGGDEPRKGGA